jgi:hypothetical protein
LLADTTRLLQYRLDRSEGVVVQDQVEVTVGKRSWEHKGQNLVEKIRFKGERLGHYTSDTELDDSRLNRRETIYTLYRCPDGYRVARTLFDSRRRRERARWSKKEALTELLPKADGTDDGAPMLGAEYGYYSEDDA